QREFPRRRHPPLRRRWPPHRGRPVTEDLLATLRANDIAGAIGPLGKPADAALLDEWQRSGVRFVSKAPKLTARYYQAVRELFDCIAPSADDTPILHEGGIYHGCWLESTGTINAELLSRFIPSVAERTFAGFAAHQREDGLLPYKLTQDGATFAQIQLVTPLARSVWTHYQLNGRDRSYLAKMYEAMSHYDEWLATWRNTRGTGGVEAFCCYDTGHDLSPRFWHIPDSPLHNDPKAYDTGNPLLPL